MKPLRKLKNLVSLQAKRKPLVMKSNNPIEESRRYVENAQKVLRENGKLDKDKIFYEDPKYVRAAGNYLWLGVLLALEAVFHLKKQKNSRVDIDDYKALITKRDKKLLTILNDAYNVLHLSMTYDGIQSKKICDEGFSYANTIIDRCASMLPNP